MKLSSSSLSCYLSHQVSSWNIGHIFLWDESMFPGVCVIWNSISQPCITLHWFLPQIHWARSFRGGCVHNIPQEFWSEIWRTTTKAKHLNGVQEVVFQKKKKKIPPFMIMSRDLHGKLLCQVPETCITHIGPFPMSREYEILLTLGPPDMSASCKWKLGMVNSRSTF